MISSTTHDPPPATPKQSITSTVFKTLANLLIGIAIIIPVTVTIGGKKTIKRLK